MIDYKEPQGTVQRTVPWGVLLCIIESVGANLKKTKCLNRTNVIASQCSHWRGNPPDFQTSTLGNLGFYAYPGDCHTSDIGHWFAMTLYILAILTHRGS